MANIFDCSNPHICTLRNQPFSFLANLRPKVPRAHHENKHSLETPSSGKTSAYCEAAIKTNMRPTSLPVRNKEILFPISVLPGELLRLSGTPHGTQPQRSGRNGWGPFKLTDDSDAHHGLAATLDQRIRRKYEPVRWLHSGTHNA